MHNTHFPEVVSLSTKNAQLPGWVTVKDAALLLGCSQQNVRSNWLPGLDPEHIREGRPLRLRMSALVDLMAERRADEQIKATDDPLLIGGGESPALERYRAARAAHAELDLAQRKGELIEREKAREILMRWALILRSTGERLGKKHGNDAMTIFTDALDRCRLVISEFEGTEK